MLVEGFDVYLYIIEELACGDECHECLMLIQSPHHHIICLQTGWCDVDISTLVRKPTWFKWTLMPFAYIMQTTAADHGNLSHEHWIIDFAMAVHHFPPTLESAKCLLYNTSSLAVVEAVLLGWQTTSFVALHASCSQWKDCISSKKRIHLHSFNCL